MFSLFELKCMMFHKIRNDYRSTHLGFRTGKLGFVTGTLGSETGTLGFETRKLRFQTGTLGFRTVSLPFRTGKLGFVTGTLDLLIRSVRFRNCCRLRTLTQKIPGKNSGDSVMIESGCYFLINFTLLARPLSSTVII